MTTDRSSRLNGSEDHGYGYEAIRFGEARARVRASRAAA